MDKTIWLSVIREELGLLNSLATGMIDDATLTREEIELAISRSKVVVSEFEMLLNNLPTPGSQEKWAEETVAKPEKEPVVSTEPVISETLVTEEIEFSMEEETEPVQTVLPEDSPLPSLSPSPSPPLVSSPGPQVSESPRLPLSPSPPPFPPFSKNEELPVYSLDDKKEESTPYHAAPIKSLKEGLSLNDRYLFQRELFNNDKSRLDESVAALDRLNNIHEAVDYLKANFRWNKSEASEKFVQLVKRRFS